MVHGPHAYSYRPQLTRYAVVGDTVAVGLATRNGQHRPFIHSAGRLDAFMYQVSEQQMRSLPQGARVIVAAGTSEVIEATRSGLDPQRFSQTVHMGLTMILREAQMRGHSVSHIVGPMSPRLMGIQNPAFMHNAMMADRIMENIARQNGIGYVSTIRNEAALAQNGHQGMLYDNLRSIVAATPTSAPHARMPHGQSPHYGHGYQPHTYTQDRTPTYYRSRPPSMLDALTARLTSSIIGGNHHGHSHYGHSSYGHSPYGHSPNPTMRVRTRVYVDDQTGQVLGQESRVVSPHYSPSPHMSNYGFRPQGYNMGASPMSFNPAAFIAGAALGSLLNRSRDNHRPQQIYTQPVVHRPVIVQPPTTIINNTYVRPPHHHGPHHHAGQHPHRQAVAPTPTVPVRTAVVSPTPPAHHQHRHPPAGAPHQHRPPQPRTQT